MLFRSSLSHRVGWYSNENLISKSSEKYELSEDENGAYLIIRSVNETDQHEYKVVITNEKESTTFKTYLYIEGKNRFHLIINNLVYKQSRNDNNH